MKEEIKSYLCRLCLSLIEDDTFDILDEIKKEMIAILLPQWNTNINNNSVLCTVCAENLKELSNLKTEFLNYLSNPTTDKMEQENQINCTLCSMMNEEVCSIGENTLLKEMLEKCFTGLELTEQTSVCKECLVSLQSLFNFIKTCSDVEEKITTYLAKSGGDEENEINLFNVLQSEEVEKSDHFMSSYSNLELNSIKEENTEFNEIITVEESKIDFTTDIKQESSIGEDDVEIKFHEDEEEKEIYKCNLCNYQNPKKKNLLGHMLKHKKPGEVPMYKCGKCDYQSKRKSDLSQHLIKHKDDGEVYKCHLCYYKTVIKSKLEEHVSRHELPEKYKCECCPFKAVYKRSLMQHMRTHKIYKYQITNGNKTNYHSGLINCHSNVTKKLFSMVNEATNENSERSNSDVYIKLDNGESFANDKEMANYSNNYFINVGQKMTEKINTPNLTPQNNYSQVKHKNKLDKHILKHQEAEVTMIICPYCPAGAKQKEYLTSRNQIIKTPEERKKFKCDLCSFETKHKPYLKKHLMLHETKEDKILDCNLCSYKTFMKGNLVKHRKTHFIAE